MTFPYFIFTGRVVKPGIMEFLREFVSFLIKRKRWWLVPLATVLLLAGLLIAAAQGSALAPFIYSIF